MWSVLSDRLKLLDKEYFASVERISSSHRRCEQLGLARDIPCARDVLDTSGIEETLSYNCGLIAFANLLFATTSDLIPDKRTLLILCDARARIIAIHSIPEVIRAAANKGICLGASVAEDSLGTNAVSLALYDLKPAILCGEQHYCDILQDWFCIAIPLIDAHGSPLGCLDISTGHETALGEKLAVATFLSRELSSYGVRKPSPVLTLRQQQVLRLFSTGLSYKQIARRLELQSIRTVQEHLDAVRAKLGASTRRDCIRRALEYRLL